MARTLSDLRPVYVVGAGWHGYQNPSEAPYVTLGLAAIREALADARIEWPAVESTYIATPLLGMAAGRPTLRQLGTTGAPLLHIENASASGSTAFRHACIEVASGISDVALAVGVDKQSRAALGNRHRSSRRRCNRSIYALCALHQRVYLPLQRFDRGHCARCR
jgi:acetyl-CoA acetyltransferase